MTDRDAHSSAPAGNAQSTRYVLLDEPLNNLDPRHMTEIMKLVRRKADELDRIVAMRDGRIVADAARDQIMRPEVLHAVYETPVDVREIDGRPVALYYG